MNSKDVLNKIAKMLNLSAEVTVLTDAKTADGTILQSPTFDLGEEVEVVSEDGTKTPAPDGEHEIALKDSEGKEVIIRIVTKDGKITERENVEEAQPEVPEEGEAEIESETEMSDEAKGALKTDEAHALPNTTDEDPRNRIGNDTDDMKDPIIAMSARIEQLEKICAGLVEKMNSAYPEEGQEVSSLTPNPSLEMAEVEEEELPKLDGAPIDPIAKFAAQNKNNYGKKDAGYQNSFLSKLYK